MGLVSASLTDELAAARRAAEEAGNGRCAAEERHRAAQQELQALQAEQQVDLLPFTRMSSISDAIVSRLGQSGPCQDRKHIYCAGRLLSSTIESPPLHHAAA